MSGASPSAPAARGRTIIRPRVVEKLARAAVREPGHWWHDAVTAVRVHGAVEGASAALRLEVEIVVPFTARALGADICQQVTTRVHDLAGVTVRRLHVQLVPVAAPHPRRVR
jgi:hypothetical protein